VYHSPITIHNNFTESTTTPTQKTKIIRKEKEGKNRANGGEREKFPPPFSSPPIRNIGKAFESLSSGFVFRKV
jgi:hypothetical protein